MTPDKKKLRQEWRTPDNFFKVLDALFHFDIDVCASAQNRKVERYIDEAKNALAEDTSWFEDGITSAFCNPGFNNMLPWVTKAHRETESGGLAVVLGLCAPSAAWFQYAVEYASSIQLLRPRVQYVLPDVKNSSNPRECAAFVFRNTGGKAIITHWNWKGAQ